jgi:hypothetical protein
VITKQVNPPLVEAGREKIAIEELVLGLRRIVSVSEHAPDCRCLRAIALQTLKDASRWIEIPGGES